MASPVRLCLFASVLGAFVSACGGETSSSGAGSSVVCSGATPAACGGNVVGKWQLTDFCLTSTTISLSSCPGGTATVTSASVTGTVEYRTDGTETAIMSGTTSATYSMPVSCLSGTCADAASRLMGDPDVTSATCSQSGDNCICPVTLHTSSTDDYTYTVSGSTITETTTATGETNAYDFCVSGDTLTANQPDGIYRAKRL